MGKLLSIITSLHKKTRRDYLERMINDKVKCAKIAKEYGFEYWDGNRKYGYGGYKYDGRWEVVAKKLIKKYKLTNKSKVLDVGCGKGYLLFEIKKLLPGCKVVGFDISRYGLKNAKEEVKKYLYYGKAQDKYSYGNRQFNLVISINSLHNLGISELSRALTEIERVGKKKYITVESYRNVQELFNLECWALTCEAFFAKKEWIWLFDHFGYKGDFEFIYFE